MAQLESPKGMSIIARTAGIGRTAPELQWDLNYLLKLWNAIDGAAKSAKGAFLIYQEDRKSTRLNSSHLVISYAVFCLKKKNDNILRQRLEGQHRRRVENDPRIVLLKAIL